MARWQPSDSASNAEKKSWADKPTWYAQYPSENTGAEKPESYETNLALARAHVEWLLDPKNGQQNVQSPDDLHWVTVAVMYDPSSKWHFASTVPRGKRWGIMKNNKQIAPKWKESVGDSNWFHAEDAAYFNFESSGKASALNPYPRGAIIATFGKRDPQKEDDFPDGKLPIPACSQSGKYPTCQQVAKKLGVSFATFINEKEKDYRLWTPPPSEYGDDITMEDWDEIERQLCEQQGQGEPKRLAIRGREVPVDIRDGSSCRTDVYGSTPVLTFSYTQSLDQSSISNNFTIITPSESTTTSTHSGGTITHSSTHTTPIPSCSMQQEDPDAGITTRYCVCDQSRTLPLLTFSKPIFVSSSCSYTTLPPKETTKASKRDAAPITRPPEAMITPAPTLDDRDISVHTGFDSTTTDLKWCKVCSRVEVNEDSCSSIKGCFIKTGAVTIEAGTSSVHVGTVTGTKLYSGVSSALEKICPTPSAKGDTSCSGDTASIGGVPYVDAGFLNKDGELVISVESSKYNETSIRDALIKSAAKAAQQAAMGKNCYKQTYEIEVMKRSWLPSWVPSFMRRDHPFPMEESATWCNTVGFAGPHYYNPWWRTAPKPGATDYIDAHWEFEAAGGGEFECALLEGAIDAFAFVQPEFALGDIELGQAIEIACMSGESERRRRSLQNVTLEA